MRLPRARLDAWRAHCKDRASQWGAIRLRPLDLLRLWHERIEAWMPAEAGIEAPKVGQGQAASLRMVGGGADASH